MTQTAATSSSPAARTDLPPVRSAPPCGNPHVRTWVDETLTMLRPAEVVWCDGSDAQQKAFYTRGVAEGVFIELNQKKLPGCYLHRSNPNDVART